MQREKKMREAVKQHRQKDKGCTLSKTKLYFSPLGSPERKIDMRIDENNNTVVVWYSGDM